MNLNKIRLSGNLTGREIEIIYNSLHVKGNKQFLLRQIDVRTFYEDSNFDQSNITGPLAVNDGEYPGQILSIMFLIVQRDSA